MIGGIKECRKCGSEKLVKNGSNAVGNAKYKRSAAFSFVRGKWRQKWLWLAQNRKTRQVVAFYIGDRSKENWRKLWHSYSTVGLLLSP